MKINSQVILFLLLLLPFGVFSEQILSQKIINDQATETVYIPQHLDDSFEIAQAIIRIEKAGSLVSEKIIYTLNKQITTGIVSCENKYSDGSRITEFIENMSIEFYDRSGYNKRIKRINDAKEITEISFFDNDTLLFTTSEVKVEDAYPIYKIDFISDYLSAKTLSGYFINQNNYLLCEKGTSCFYLSGDPIALSEYDTSVLQKISESKGWDDISQVFTRKIKVRSGNKEFYLLLQDGIMEDFIQRKQAAVPYLACMPDSEIFLVGVHPLH